MSLKLYKVHDGITSLYMYRMSSPAALMHMAEHECNALTNTYLARHLVVSALAMQQSHDNAKGCMQAG